jgi:hypothetical protein
MTPEAAARQKIDAVLGAGGWAVQDYTAFNPAAARGIALREVPLASGRCDYLLLVDRIPLGVVEAKKEGTTLSAVSEQSAHYGENLPAFLAALLPGTKRIPFAEQTRIVAEVESCVSLVDELETVVNANLQRATRLRHSVLQLALYGELLTA